ncbi:hypothetical protein EDF56_10799 [Novosphingobium sp. PhB165]|uniref:CocE/NonD family hydrolase n=1 Tax=Novosphingobium sp. PhB165 TaxID=2485105 RepID=UPI001048846F|nr:CocE/NonD family hydrolase [Novosphingobium sp. PhB165]TCM16520.1 hypothetical protein EDF56_10799 [Novosphingobium sp. PhB165]
MIVQYVLRGIAGRLLKLPPRTNTIRREKALGIPMRDGTTLVADRYFPAKGKARATVLMRSPYGRGFIIGFSAALLAERGLNVVVQSVRATDGSGGEFDPVRQERDDGVDTALWVRDQPWFGGKLYLFGGSYLGFVAWALASERPDLVDGAALTVTSSNFAQALREGGGLALFTALSWTRQMHDSISTGKSPFFGGKMLAPSAFSHLPLGSIDKNAFQVTNRWWQDWIVHDPDDRWWEAMDFSSGVTRLDAPVLLVAGWQDLFLPYQLDDFAARQSAGLPTWITIGPWEHGGPSGLFEGQRQSIEFLTSLARGTSANPLERAPVRLYVQGAGEWQEYEQWPPHSGAPLRMHLHADGGLSHNAADAHEGSTHYRYDPSDPTPSLYGPVTVPAKSRDLSAYDMCSDRAKFTSPSLRKDFEIIGAVDAELYVRTSRPWTDFYVAFCQVHENGSAIHICDGYVRLDEHVSPADADGVRKVTVRCWPTAWLLPAGARLRIYVTSACFPRYARNCGTGEPLATATQMAANDVEILHTQDHPSCLMLYPSDGIPPVFAD